MAAATTQVWQGVGTDGGQRTINRELFQLKLDEQLDEDDHSKRAGLAIHAWSWDDFATYSTLFDAQPKNSK
jgi:hypothetical protein